MQVFPTRLKRYRKHLKITQEEVAKRANTTIANISGYESGTQYPSAGMLLRLSNALDCSLDYLFGLTNNPSRLNSNPINNQQLSAIELINQYTIFIEGQPLSKEDVKDMFGYIMVRRLMKKK